MTIPSHEDLKRHGIEILHETGPTWNDGGCWNRWIYRLNNRFWRVNQPTDYHLDVSVTEVNRKETVVVTYEEVSDDAAGQTRNLMKKDPAKSDPELSRLLAKAKDHIMTMEEVEAQRQSFAKAMKPTGDPRFD